VDLVPWGAPLMAAVSRPALLRSGGKKFYKKLLLQPLDLSGIPWVYHLSIFQITRLFPLISVIFAADP